MSEPLGRYYNPSGGTRGKGPFLFFHAKFWEAILLTKIGHVSCRALVNASSEETVRACLESPICREAELKNLVVGEINPLVGKECSERVDKQIYALTCLTLPDNAEGKYSGCAHYYGLPEGIVEYIFLKWGNKEQPFEIGAPV
ncbi:MAG: hypothetical protein PHY92_07970, partial [Alphaproteobacteria bacterium]|nr:hypothetical protein [Alphaproteobacteria bacterium]